MATERGRVLEVWAIPVLGARVAGGVHPGEKCESLIVERDVLGFFLLRVMRRLCPHAALEIEL
jgi:hypothetical protein